MDIVRTVGDLRKRVGAWRAEGYRVGLVPTMGALHEGHLSLVKRALDIADRVVGTVFVNPKQFGLGEDLDTYPRDETGDANKLEGAGCHLLFAPEVAEMYRADATTRVSVAGLGDLLEDTYRPGFFTGVATVVTKLLLQALPDIAVFGEKDYQQLQVIRRLVSDLDIPVAVEGAPTVREADGFALSSRNVYLTQEQRRIAPVLFTTVTTMEHRARAGEDPAMLEEWAAFQLISVGFDKVDYVTIRDAETLGTGPEPGRPRRILAAAWLGKVRLIDNIAV